MGIFGELQEFIYRDVKNENESKRKAVIIRFYDVIMCLYYLILAIALVADGHIWIFWLAPPCLVLYIVSFFLSYMDRTMRAIYISMGATFLWVLLNVLSLGWDSGVQHFIFVLIIMIFPLLLGKIKYKIGLAMVLCGVRIALYFYTSTAQPLLILTPGSSVFFQVFNTITVCLQGAVILALYTMDSVEMEQKLVEYNRKLHKMASMDPLTGLYNRRGIYEYLESNTKIYKANEMKGLSVAIGDIDFFKKVNDEYGHEAGDEVLKNLSRRMEEMLEGRGNVGRWGGEEFLLIFHDMNGDDAALKLEEIRNELKRLHVSYQGNDIYVTMTFGLTEYDSTKEIEETIRTADQKLYVGKESGRNRIIY